MPDQPQRPVGERYSFNYLQRPLQVKDSKRLRIRFHSAFQQQSLYRSNEFAALVRGELGIKIAIGDYPYWHSLFEECELRDLLDILTLIARALPQNACVRWRNSVERIFREEQTAYTTDEMCGIHPYVDAEFQRVRLDTISALSDERYAGAASNIVKAYDALHGSPIEARDAIQHMFEANESLFRLLAPRAPRLGASEARTALAPIIDRYFGGDPVATRSMQQMLGSFCSWVDAAHHYRHAAGEGQPAEPPQEVWQLLISQGGGFARWLGQLDRPTRP